MLGYPYQPIRYRYKGWEGQFGVVVGNRNDDIVGLDKCIVVVG